MMQHIFVTFAAHLLHQKLKQ